MLEDSCSLCRILPEISTINIKKFVSRLVDDSLPQIHSLIFDTRVQAYRATFWRRESILSPIYKKKKKKRRIYLKWLSYSLKRKIFFILFLRLLSLSFSLILPLSFISFPFCLILFSFSYAFPRYAFFFNSLFTQF